ncbi:MAG TPA: DoxX family protein, partial [Polyangiaceae bacterium]
AISAFRFTAGISGLAPHRCFFCRRADDFLEPPESMGQILSDEAPMTMMTNDRPQFHSPSQAPQESTGAALWTGRVLSALGVLFLTMDASMKLLRLAPAVQGTVQLGYPESVVFGLGVVQLLCLVVYLVPRTALLGAVLWTGYLGGAIATHVRVQNPLFSHVLFPVYVAILLWGGLCLRQPRVRALLLPSIVNRRGS